MSNYFTDRIVQHPGRITLTPTGGSDEYDVDRAEGTVTTPGTPFNAESMNGAVDLYGFYYGTSSTAAGTADKVVTCTGFTLVTGAKIAVKFSNGNTYNGQITLNVNGTGAKNVYDYGEYYDGYSRCAWDANQTMVFVYDGTRWNLVNGELITDASLDALETALSISSAKDRLFNILSAMVLKTHQVNYSLPAFTAGDYGYLTIPNTAGVESIASKTIAIRLSSGSIAGLSGLQLFPIGLNDSNIYVQYYSPKAIAAGYPLAVVITTVGEGV